MNNFNAHRYNSVFMFTLFPKGDTFNLPNGVQKREIDTCTLVMTSLTSSNEATVTGAILETNVIISYREINDVSLDVITRIV